MMLKGERGIRKSSLIWLTLVGLAGAQCPTGWIGSTDLGCYQFLTAQTDMSWLDAKVQCEIVGGYLAELKTESASQFVTGIAGIFSAFATNWHIGLTDLEVEGTWQWFLSHDAVSYTNWGTGSPDITAFNTKDCAYLEAIGGTATWTDSSCTKVTLGSAPLCEYSLTPIAPTGATATATAATATATTATATATVTSSTITCQSGGSLFGGRCYTFQTASSPRTWSQAEAACVALGGHLTSVHSLEEENFIEAMAQAFNGRTQTYWMGAKPNALGTWEWIDGSAWDYKHFVNNNEAAPFGTCLLQYGAYYDDSKYGWSFRDCSALLYGIVCKI